MNIEKLPLSRRINNMKTGHVAHPEFIPHSIMTMAETPLRIYLCNFEQQRVRLSRLLHLTPQEEQTLTYRDIACRIASLRETCPGMAGKAAEIISTPLEKCYQERKDAYGKSSFAD